MIARLGNVGRSFVVKRLDIILFCSFLLFVLQWQFHLFTTLRGVLCFPFCSNKLAREAWQRLLGKLWLFRHSIPPFRISKTDANIVNPSALLDYFLWMAMCTKKRSKTRIELLTVWFRLTKIKSWIRHLLWTQPKKPVVNFDNKLLLLVHFVHGNWKFNHGFIFPLFCVILTVYTWVVNMNIDFLTVILKKLPHPPISAYGRFF